MQLLLDVFGYLSVLLRGAEITAQSLVVGGLIFSLAVVRPNMAALGTAGPAIATACRRWTRWSALGFALAAATLIAMEGSVLGATADLTFLEVAGANFFEASATAIVAALVLFAIVRPTTIRAAASYLLVPGAIIIGAAAMTSHAAARMDYRPALMIADFAHQAAAAIWIGGIPYFLIALNRAGEDKSATAATAASFSRLATIAVALLLAAGVGMSLVYVDSLAAIYGTAYGAMLVAKVVLFLCLLGFGYFNNRISRRLQQDAKAPAYRLRRFAEAEVGIGLTVFFLAASFTSQPPAADLQDDRVTWAEVVSRMAPEVPVLTSPNHASLAIPRLQAKLDAEASAVSKPAPAAFIPGAGVSPPRDAADILWSEYNHHWSGIFVLVIGLLGLAEKSGRAPWARHWPLIFLPLALFLTLRSDPEVWPLGDVGFFASLRDPEVLQHRAFVVLIIIFGLFEWGVRTGRITSQRAALVFPLITAVGGALLLTHNHALSNVKEQLLIELTHLPMGVLGVIAGWARWLEIKLPPAERSLPGWTWCICFCLIGLLLLDYRESG